MYCGGAHPPHTSRSPRTSLRVVKLASSGSDCEKSKEIVISASVASYLCSKSVLVVRLGKALSITMYVW